MAQAPDGTLYAGNLDGDFYTSADDGLSWTQMCNFAGGISAVRVLPSGKLICVTGYFSIKGHFYESIDGGANWKANGDTSFYTNIPGSVVDLLVAQDGSLLLLTTNCVCRSTDEGTHWLTMFKDTTDHISCGCLDSCGHILVGFYNRIRCCAVGDTIWTDLGYSFGSRLFGLSISPNGDIIAANSQFGAGVISIFRDGVWTHQRRIPSNVWSYEPIAVDSSGIMYLMFDGTYTSADYGKTAHQTYEGGRCDQIYYFISKSGHLFALNACGVLRSINRVGDTILHFPITSTPGCSSKAIITNLNHIGSFAVTPNWIYVSNGGVAEIPWSGGAIGYLTSMPEPHGGPFVIHGDDCYFVNYDIDHPELNWSKISKISITQGGLAQQNIIVRAKRIVDLKYSDSSLYWMCSASTDSLLRHDGMLQRLVLSTQSIQTIADSISALDGFSIVSDSIVFGERTTSDRTGGLKIISKVGGAARVITSESIGGIDADSANILYYSYDAGAVYLRSRRTDSVENLLMIRDSNIQVWGDQNYVYCLASGLCGSNGSLTRISRSSRTSLILDDSVGCNPFIVVESPLLYLSDDVNGGRIRTICNSSNQGYAEPTVPGLLDFGVVAIGKTKVAQLPIKNPSSTNLTVYGTIRDGNFSLYPPSLSIPARSEMSFKVYHTSTSGSPVDDLALFSVNGSVPYASTILHSEGDLGVTPQGTENSKPQLRFLNGDLMVEFASGPYSLTVCDLLGRVVERWDGISNRGDNIFHIPASNQFLFVSLLQSGERQVLKLVR
ncbi:MAG: hypothetical protein Q8922_05035 [Bacteroidota bacterium]|nr:hypothetical protein [Bacteroidota bacterium]MDP4231934.1 hypothetical protein [Bacteroidota bacterium]MDP4241359.1 hypothetical protein [Bacteroidota bacterium]MDP4287282.1 hypothetical protein [Bacteroidota bacterium]